MQSFRCVSIYPSVLSVFFCWWPSGLCIFVNVTSLLFGRTIENWRYPLFINSIQGHIFFLQNSLLVSGIKSKKQWNWQSKHVQYFGYRERFRPIKAIQDYTQWIVYFIFLVKNLKEHFVKELFTEHNHQYSLTHSFKEIVKLLQKGEWQKVILNLHSVIMYKTHRNNIFIAVNRNRISVISITSSQNVDHTYIQNWKSVFVQVL
jgi:hypothetical protein